MLFADQYPIGEVKRWQDELIKFMKTQHPDQLQEIADAKVISDDLEGKLKASLEEFNQGFSPEQAA